MISISHHEENEMSIQRNMYKNITRVVPKSTIVHNSQFLLQLLQPNVHVPHHYNEQNKISHRFVNKLLYRVCWFTISF